MRPINYIMNTNRSINRFEAVLKLMIRVIGIFESCVGCSSSSVDDNY